ncbi:LOW QUALITY PROTEIN: FYN-binding protein 1 [Antennarius striatus]|uniref:LOW QUALITY PROTEIN: FYN-binding protein 1 n=1 Tax=Antennarius striatus TaxID=241820 RepID=UPI0035B00553
MCVSGTHQRALEGPIDFKALRAKFQEEGLLAQPKPSRPAVAEKPKNLPPPPPPLPAAHSSNMPIYVNIQTEVRATVGTRLLLRDGLRASGGKRPVTYPPQPQPRSPVSQPAEGDGAPKLSLRERHMPLVLPVPPVRELRTEPPARKEHKPEPEAGKDVKPQTKAKKKALLPFPSVKPPKVSVDSKKEPVYINVLPSDAKKEPVYINVLPSDAGDTPAMKKTVSEDRFSPPGDQPTAEVGPTSPDVPGSPLSPDSSFENNSKFSTTLEKARKKFSCKQMLISAKPRSARSPEAPSKDKPLPSPPERTEAVEPEPPLQTYLPPLSSLSAQPVVRPKIPSSKAAMEKRSGKTEGPSGAHPPPRKPLPDLWSLGPAPQKPPRPLVVDINYYLLPEDEDSPGSSQEPSEEPESEHASFALEAPDFPDFDSSDMDMAEGEAVDIAALDLGALDLVGADPLAPQDSGGAGFEGPGPDSPDPAEIKRLQVQSVCYQNIMALTPPGLPQTAGTDTPPYVDVDARCEEIYGAHGVSAAPGTLKDIPLYAGEQYDDDVYEDVVVKKSSLMSHKHKGLRRVRRFSSTKVPVSFIEFTSLSSSPQIQGPLLLLLSPYKDRQSPHAAAHKEQKKREKQRLEKEKKEQKEREKKENEMKKKFKVTGSEEPLYHTKVVVVSKVRKNDLPVKSGDTVSIIRTTNCPKGKWLARDANNKYGYISVMNVELNIKEMLELGKKAQAAGRGGGNVEPDTISNGSRSSSHPALTSSFTDDSEEWACDESPSFSQRPASMHELLGAHGAGQHPMSDASPEELKQEALQKLATFFRSRPEDDDGADGAAGDPPSIYEKPDALVAEEPAYLAPDDITPDEELLPPPQLYANTP